MDIKKGIETLVSTAMDAKAICDSMDALGYDKTPYHTLFFSISDAIYSMLEEHTETFIESRTYAALYPENIPIEKRVKILLGE